jgi:hypothetical protein
MIRAVMIIVALCALASGAAAQSLCWRPEPPPDLAPPEDDPDLRAFLNEEYARYMEDVEDYLNCANDEAHAVMEESRAVLARWTAYYGAEAAIRKK